MTKISDLFQFNYLDAYKITCKFTNDPELAPYQMAILTTDNCLKIYIDRDFEDLNNLELAEVFYTLKKELVYQSWSKECIDISQYLASLDICTITATVFPHSNTVKFDYCRSTKYYDMYSENNTYIVPVLDNLELDSIPF